MELIQHPMGKLLLTTEALRTQRKAFSFAGRYRQMKKSCPQELVAGYVQ